MIFGSNLEEHKLWAKKKEGKIHPKIRGASEHNLKSVSLDIPRDEFVFLQGFQAQASHHWHLIPYMLRGSAGIWSHFHRMHVSF